MLKQAALVAMLAVFGLNGEEAEVPAALENSEEMELVLSEQVEEMSNTDLAYRQRESCSSQTERCRPRKEESCRKEEKCKKHNQCKQGERKGAARKVVEGD